MNAHRYYDNLLSTLAKQAAAEALLKQEVDAFVLTRLQLLQQVGRSVASKCYGKGWWAIPLTEVGGQAWVFKTIVRFELTPTTIKLFLRTYGAGPSAPLQEETLMRETLHMSDRAYASKMRRAIRLRQAALAEEAERTKSTKLAALRKTLEETQQAIARLEKASEAK